MSRNIAIIPARSGSKGVKDKNIREINNKPLIAYAIEAAKETRLFDIIHVSTDSDRYADIAKNYGADVPFLRDTGISGDNSSTWDAVKYVLEEYKKINQEFDVITLLQPTSPTRTKDDIIGAMKFFEEKDANMVSSVCEMEHSPLWSNTLPQDLSMENFEDEKVAFLPRQSLPIYYRENGAVYILKKEHLLYSENIYKDKCFAYIMDRENSVDIDTEFDLLMAQLILEKRV